MLNKRQGMKRVDRWKRGTDSRKRMWTHGRGVLTAGKGCGHMDEGY
jgi:hypothetical protein